MKPAITRGFDGRYRILMRNNNQECVHLLEPVQTHPITVERHHHAFYEVLFIVSGELKYEVEGRHYLRIFGTRANELSKAPYFRGFTTCIHGVEVMLLWAVHRHDALRLACNGHS